MLENFFRLNSPFVVFDEQEKLINPLLNSNDLRDVLFKPDELKYPFPTTPNNPFIGKTFTNISFSKTTISGVIFRDCEFVDCLFIGTRFVDCEFHNCNFKGCNPHKVTFRNTYINPSAFEGVLDPVEHWNIGMHLFQQLYDNAIDSRQREFANTAEFNRSKWKRYVLDHEYPGWDRKSPKYLWEWSKNFLYYILAGYGIRAKFLAAWAFLVATISVSINFLFWDSLNVVGKNGPVGSRDVIEVLYYTATIPSGLGDFTPTSSLGRLIFLGEAFFGLVIISLFATWIVKRALH